MSAIQFDPMLFGEDESSGLPVIVLAADLSGASAMLLIQDSDGLLIWRPVEGIRTNWRWAANRGWYDVDVKEVESQDG